MWSNDMCVYFVCSVWGVYGGVCIKLVCGGVNGSVLYFSLLLFVYFVSHVFCNGGLAKCCDVWCMWVFMLSWCWSSVMHFCSVYVWCSLVTVLCVLGFLGHLSCGDPLDEWMFVTCVVVVVFCVFG